MRKQGAQTVSGLYWLSVFPHLPHRRIGVFMAAPIVPRLSGNFRELPPTGHAQTDIATAISLQRCIPVSTTPKLVPRPQNGAAAERGGVCQRIREGIHLCLQQRQPRSGRQRGARSLWAQQRHLPVRKLPAPPATPQEQ